MTKVMTAQEKFYSVLEVLSQYPIYWHELDTLSAVSKVSNVDALTISRKFVNQGLSYVKPNGTNTMKSQLMITELGITTWTTFSASLDNHENKEAMRQWEDEKKTIELEKKEVQPELITEETEVEII